MASPRRTRMVKVDDLAGTAEVAAYFGVKVSVISNWKRRYRHFPAPVAELACGAIYLLPEVVDWYNSGTDRTWLDV